MRAGTVIQQQIFTCLSAMCHCPASEGGNLCTLGGGTLGRVQQITESNFNEYMTLVIFCCGRLLAYLESEVT